MTDVTLTRPRAASPKKAARALRSFYSRPVGWGGALAVSAVLAYIGGAAMFWLHAIYRQEHGPAIGHVQHWFLDSTLGFIALTPVVLLLLPAALWMRTKNDRERRLRLGTYVVLVGVLFAFVTGPGPFLHNQLVGQGTPLAHLATNVFGEDRAMESDTVGKDHSALSEGTLQVLVGIPLYTLLTWGALGVLRRTSAGQRSRERVPSSAA